MNSCDHILTDLIYALLQITVLLIREDRLEHGGLH